MTLRRLVAILPVFLFLFVLIPPALADVPLEWHLGFQPAATPVAERLHEFHNMLLWIITGIACFVLALLVFVVLRFNARANPVPSKTSHNVLLEVVWTVIPVVILIIIVIPSIQLLYYMESAGKPDMTLKVTGYQWYWGYEYPDHGGVSLTANMIPDKDIKKEKGQIRLLSTDNPVVVPVDTNIEVLITATDVIHAFTVPAFGVKRDAVPGRLNHSWMRIEKPGTYYGQCSELCGTGHAYMPIEFKAVPKAEFETWIAEKKKEQGIGEKATTAPLAVAQPVVQEQPK